MRLLGRHGRGGGERTEQMITYEHVREILLGAVEDPQPHGDTSNVADAGVDALGRGWVEAAVRLSRLRVLLRGSSHGELQVVTRVGGEVEVAAPEAAGRWRARSRDARLNRQSKQRGEAKGMTEDESTCPCVYDSLARDIGIFAFLLAWSSALEKKEDWNESEPNILCNI